MRAGKNHPATGTRTPTSPTSTPSSRQSGRLNRRGRNSDRNHTPCVLPGNNVIEAYSYYITGQVYDEYFVDEYVEDFRKLREHINKMLEKRSMEKSKA
nr:hypothetical protein Itr_chr07CG10650 [Ipomoea trifida]